MFCNHIQYTLGFSFNIHSIQKFWRFLLATHVAIWKKQMTDLYLSRWQTDAVMQHRLQTFCSTLKHRVISRGHEYPSVVSSRWQTAPTSSGMRVILCIGRARNDDRGCRWQSAAASRRSTMYLNSSFWCLHTFKSSLSSLSNTCWCLGREWWPMEHEVLLFLVLLSGIFCHRLHVYGHYTWTISEWTKHNTVSFGLRDMTRHFRDCLGR